MEAVTWLDHGTVERPALALAPMEGVSDAVARAVLSELGGMDACVTEFVRVVDGPVPARVLRRDCPELDARGRTSAGVPVLVQLLGSNLTAMAETAQRAVDLGATAIDLNFGCPAKRVNGHDGGAALLKTPSRMEATIRAVRRALPLSVPVSAKIRLGWDNPNEVLDLARAAEGGGASALTIHGRTKRQMYAPPADWGSIARAREVVRIPVVANGDLFSPEAVRACVRETGCSAVMIGRGAFRIPNLFRWIRGLDAEPWSPLRSAALLRRFARLMPEMRRLDHPERAVLARLKQWVRYLSVASSEMEACFEVLKRRQTLEEARQDLDRFFPPLPDEDPEVTAFALARTERRVCIADAASTV